MVFYTRSTIKGYIRGREREGEGGREREREREGKEGGRERLTVITLMHVH